MTVGGGARGLVPYKPSIKDKEAIKQDVLF
jgi:hypothetical protein